MENVEVSIRITLPKEINSVLMKEKKRFVSEYGSSYKSEPHITLYLGRYTEEGFPKLIADLKKISFEPVTFSLLGLKMNKGEHNNVYVVDVSNKTQLSELHVRVSEIASKYQSHLLREKEQQRRGEGIFLEPSPFVPHITLGGIPLDATQPNIKEVRMNIKDAMGKEIHVGDMTVFYYGYKNKGDKSEIIEKVVIKF
ncbi:MAG: 2'-5' RNA ligase family protein [Parcubacteria group bacterium]